jgi:hypothetical protein
MALADTNEHDPVKVPFFGDTAGESSDRNFTRAAAQKSLKRLSQIYVETSEIFSLGRFLNGAVTSAAGLVVMGGLAVGFASSASLTVEFCWSMAVLAGVGVMLRIYIKSVAQNFDRRPLRESAKDLRAAIFYVGFAWGAGSFLLLGGNPVPFTGLCFALLPSIVMVALLKDRRASMAFILPVTLLTAASILFQPWSDAPAAIVMLLIVQGSIIAALTWTARARHGLSAGMSLR